MVRTIKQQLQGFTFSEALSFVLSLTNIYTLLLRYLSAKSLCELDHTLEIICFASAIVFVLFVVVGMFISIRITVSFNHDYSQES